MTWAATLADPERPAVLVASDDGRPTYERMGYVAVARWTAWLRPPTADRPGRPPFSGGRVVVIVTATHPTLPPPAGRNVVTPGSEHAEALAADGSPTRR